MEQDAVHYKADGSASNLTKGELKEQYIKGGTLEVMMQAKPREGVKYPSLIDLDAVNEMLEFEDFLLNIRVAVPDPKKSNYTEARFGDVCRREEMVKDIDRIKVNEACEMFRDDPAYEQYLGYCNLPEPKLWCQTTQRLLNFIYDSRTESYDMTPYKSNDHLIAKVQTGKGDPLAAKNRAIFVQTNYAGTRPRSVEQDTSDATNDLYSAEYMVYQVKMGKLPKEEKFNKEWWTYFHEQVQ